MITFAASGSVTQSGPLFAGGKVDVVYDPARLTLCRGEQQGRPQWGVTAFYALDGKTGSFPVAGVMEAPGHRVTIDLPAPGELQLWFSDTNVWGCLSWDSKYGANYRFSVGADTVGWMGNPAVVLSRGSCGSLACDGDRRALDGFVFDDWTRVRAAITRAYFDVWKHGVTDHDNPDLWKQLDVKAHVRVGAAAESWSYVPFDHRVGNDARYAFDLRPIDPLARPPQKKSDCPPGIAGSSDGVWAEVPITLTFSVAVVNGGGEGPAKTLDVGGRPFAGIFRAPKGLWAVCF